MKIFIGLLFAVVALSGALASPARSPNDDAEVINVPRRRVPSRFDDSDAEPDFRDFSGVIDTGAGYPFLQPDPHPFSFNLGFFDSFDDIFRRLRARLWPVATGGDSSDEGGFGGFDLNSKNGNTTSTVKVVDGHKVEVNETVYGSGDNLFKVRVVNIRPLESGEEVEETVRTNTAAQQPELKTVTSAPGGADDSEERREPLEKEAKDNEVSDIDDAEVKL